MENRGEERDISATQGEEKGGEVNTLKEALIGGHFCFCSFIFHFYGKVNPTCFRLKVCINMVHQCYTCTLQMGLGIKPQYVFGTDSMCP